MQIFVFLHPMWFRNEMVFLILEHSSLRGLNKKNARKNMTFWPLNSYYKRSDWKTWLAERFSEALTFKLWNKKKKKYMLPKLIKMERNWIIFIPHGFIKNLWQIHLRNSCVKFTGKYKVGNATWARLCGLIGPTNKTVFSNTGKN